MNQDQIHVKQLMCGNCQLQEINETDCGNSCLPAGLAQVLD